MQKCHPVEQLNVKNDTKRDVVSLLACLEQCGPPFHVTWRYPRLKPRRSFWLCSWALGSRQAHSPCRSQDIGNGVTWEGRQKHKGMKEGTHLQQPGEKKDLWGEIFRDQLQSSTLLLFTMICVSAELLLH